MIGSAPHEPDMQGRPGLERLAPFDKFCVGGWKLPDTIGAAHVGVERHQFAIGRGIGEIEQACHRRRDVAKRMMRRHVVHETAVDIDGAAILEARQVFLG